jgi:putative Mn2+ efflux pump MntP
LIEFSEITIPLIIGVLAGVDNFRAGIGLGALSIDPLRRKQMMLYFLIFESMMPTLGLLVGNSIGELTTADHLANFIGSAILGSLGVYVILNSTLKGKAEKKEEQEKKVVQSYWIIIGLPISLSFDNFFAGTGLGVLGFPLVLSAIIIGGVSGLMSVAGLRMGAAVKRKLASEKTDVVSGIFLLAIALFSLVNLQ